MEVSGKLIKKLQEITGTGANGTWRKADFVVEIEGEKFPRKIAFTIWGDKIDDLSRFNIGEVLTISFDIESREYQDKWYTNVTAWRINSGGGATNNVSNPPQNYSQAQNASTQNTNMAASTTTTPALALDDAPPLDDDLPF
jgi:hypothetical protein